MIDYIKGQIIEINPAEMVLECSSIGYHILISLQTFSAFEGKADATVYIHHHLREEEELYYGFATKEERQMFRLLIGVSGVGAGTARMMLSYLACDELRNAIIGENVAVIKGVKGVGVKTAQRIIIELKDKIVKGGSAELPSLAGKEKNKNADEATAALLTLGYTAQNVNKAIAAITKEHPDASIETIVRLALAHL